MVKMGETPGVFMGCARQGFVPSKASGFNTLQSIVPARQCARAGSLGSSWGPRICSPLKPPTSLTPEGSATYSGRHIIRYPLKNDTRFAPKKVQNGEILCGEGTEFKGEWDQRSWDRGRKERSWLSSYSQGEIKSGLEFCSVLRPTKEQLSFFTPTKSHSNYQLKSL